MQRRFGIALTVVWLAWWSSPPLGALAQDHPVAPSQPAPSPTPATTAVDGEGTSPTQSPENVEAVRTAREHFEAGVTHYRAHRFREAVQEFSLAAQAMPSADLWFNIARAYEQISEYDGAIEYYQRYLRDRPDAQDHTQVEQNIASLQERREAERLAHRTAPTTGTLRVDAHPDGAHVTLDGRGIGDSPLVPLSLSAGAHDLRVTNEGDIPLREHVSIIAGMTTAAYAPLAPQTRFHAVRGARIWTWIVGGLAVVSLGVAIGFGAASAGHAVIDDASLERTRELARTSDLAMGIGGLLALTSAILYFVEGRAIGTEREPASNAH